MFGFSQTVGKHFKDLLLRIVLTLIISVLTLLTFAQEAAEMTPNLGDLVDVSPENEAVWQENQRACNELMERLTAQTDMEKLSLEEKAILANCSEVFESSWDIVGSGCSWYCGGGKDSLSATSELTSSNKKRYMASNAHDLSYETAWVEGVDGTGIGERLTYHVKATNPRITEIIVVNGYVKSPKHWLENGRVKKLMMFIDNEPYAILNLQDTRREQHFKVEPIGLKTLYEWEELEQMPCWTMTFEILEVYPGDKYEDTAITEIYFDGIDVH